MTTRYGFEDLTVWTKAVDFCSEVIDLADEMTSTRKHYRLIEQLEAASASIPLNIAEGKGRYSKKEFVQFLYIARGSLYEVVTLLTIFHKKKWILDHQLTNLKTSGEEISKMLSGLISSIRESI